MNTIIISIYIFSLLLYLFGWILSSKTDLNSDKSKLFFKIGKFLLFFGFLGNSYLLIQYSYFANRPPLTNTSETLLSIITLIVLVFLVLEHKGYFPSEMGFWISLISVTGLFFAFYFFKNPMPLMPALQSKWLVYHVLSCIIAYCFFVIACITAIMNLIKQNSGAANIVRIMHRSICLGFLFLTVGIILGSVWGKAAWGHWWNWDPKEVWALITWLIYTYYFHGRLGGRWSERRLCWIAIVGFLSCLFTYLGVNFLLRGLHSYA
ncbi:MAG: cytochrome c biogenesis protein [Candidatus Scalindua sp.]